MTNFEIRRYTESDKAAWDAFVAQSKNGTFLFRRDYMDYHADRFQDCSLMIYLDGRLFALLPANEADGVFYSHHGLSYGGLVMSPQCKAAQVRDAFAMLCEYLRGQGFCKVVYKHIPWIYASLPAEEDLFALFNVCRASLRSRDVASVVMLDRRLPFSTLRRRGVKRALSAGVQVQETEDFAPFWQLLSDNLWQRFQARPVHSLAEISLLKSRFPHNIRLFTVSSADQLLGGTVLYMDSYVVKTQYISANERGKRVGALDGLFSQLLQRFEGEGRHFFDFGTSNKVYNDDLNDSLVFQKEGFGGRAVCYDVYEWSL